MERFMNYMFRNLMLAGMALSLGAQPANVVKIGWMGPETGDSALWGQSERNALQMLADDFNAKGGVDVGGRKYKLQIIPYDDKGDSVEAVNVAKRLISQDKVNAIVGAQGSGEAIPVAPLANAGKVPVISTLATNPKVTVADNGSVHPYMFRACFIDPYQGQAAAYFAYQKLAKRKAAILMTIDDPYSTGLAEFFKQNFVKAGGKVVAEVSYTSGEKDFRAPLTKLKAAQPDVVFIPAYYNDVALAAKQARELGINQLLLGGDGWPSENLVPLAGKALEGSMFINHLDMEAPAAKPMKDQYRARFKKNPELNAYIVRDALYMVLDAMKRAKSVEPSAIQKALTTCDIQGITGHIKIGPQHDPVGKEAWIIKVVGPNMKFDSKFAVKN
jgi:branched-chain amino acid transport system substrate-binding protein